MKTKKVTPEFIKVVKKIGQKSGKAYWSIGLRLGERWANGTVFSQEEADQIKALEGQETEFVFYKEEYNGKINTKFKLPWAVSKADRLEARVQSLEERVGSLEAARMPVVGVDDQPQQEQDDSLF